MTDKDLLKSQVENGAAADLFDLVFRGEIAPGNSDAEVKQRVAVSFNLDSAAADQLFSGTQVRLKRGVDRPTAERILQRLTDAGAIALIVPSSVQPETQESLPQDPLSLAPLGSNVLDANEKVEGEKVATKKPVLPSLDHLSLEPVGTRMVKETEVPPIKAPDLDTSKFSLE
jgi:hypothetical protein